MKERKRYALWSALSVSSVLMVLSGCGGGGGGSTPATPTVGVNIQGAEWVAFRDGATGNWQVLSSSNQSVSVSSPDGRYAVAYVCGGDKPVVNVVHATRAEVPQVVANCATPPSGGTVSVNVTLQGMTGASGALVGIGSASATLTNTGSINISTGTYDVIGVRFVGDVPNRLWLERNRTINTNTNYPINFDQADGTAVRVVNVSAGSLSVNALDNSPSVLEQATAQVFLNNSIVGVGASLSGNTSLTVQYPVPPSGVLQASDRFRVSVTTTAERGALGILSALPASLPVSLLAPYNSSPTFSVSPSGAVVFTVSNFAYTGASPVRGYQVSVRGEAQDARWNMFFSPGWLGNQTQITTPDFSGLSGWNSAAWDIQRGSEVIVSVRAYVSGNGSLPALLNYIAGNTDQLPAGYEVRYVTANSDPITP